jgi:hypothetical protein
LIVSRGAFPAYCVSHRGNIVDDVIAGALELAERFESLATQVERMEQRRLFKDEQLAFAARALALRFPDPAQSGMEPLQLLACRRAEDVGDDLWRVYNRCQEHLLRGGLSRRSATGRLTRTRRISSIRRDVQLNSQLCGSGRAGTGGLNGRPLPGEGARLAWRSLPFFGRRRIGDGTRCLRDHPISRPLVAEEVRCIGNRGRCAAQVPEMARGTSRIGRSFRVPRGCFRRSGVEFLRKERTYAG